MVGREIGIPETGMVGLEIGIPVMGGTGVPEKGMVVLETGVVVREVGVPDTSGTGGLERGTVEAGGGGRGRKGYVVAESRSEWRTWTVAVAGVGGETWISRM
jgi:hypothetical protein